MRDRSTAYSSGDIKVVQTLGSERLLVPLQGSLLSCPRETSSRFSCLRLKPDTTNPKSQHFSHPTEKAT